MSSKDDNFVPRGFLDLSSAVALVHERVFAVKIPDGPEPSNVLEAAGAESQDKAFRWEDIEASRAMNAMNWFALVKEQHAESVITHALVSGADS